MGSDRPISLRLPESLVEQIARRLRKLDNPGDREYTRAQAIRGALGRYYEVCWRHLKALDLSRGELAVICDALNGGLLDVEDHPGHLSVVWASIADAFALHPGYGERHGISDEQGKRLVAKLQAASYADLCAVVDFAERFWADDPEAERLVQG